MATQAPITFSNTISSPKAHHHDPHAPIESFTATGLPFTPGKPRNGSAMDSLNLAECAGLGTPCFLPRRYTDNDLITIPVLPPQVASPVDPTSPASPTTVVSFTSLPISSITSTDPITYDTPSAPRSSLRFWKSRRTSSSSSSSPIVSPSASSPSSSSSFLSKRRTRNSSFVMKWMTRGEYLKHYAKNSQGKYIGTEDPAPDCILRDEADIGKWRPNGVGMWRNEI